MPLMGDHDDYLKRGRLERDCGHNYKSEISYDDSIVQYNSDQIEGKRPLREWSTYNCHSRC